MEKCNRDCFNCQYDDCIVDDDWESCEIDKSLQQETNQRQYYKDHRDKILADKKAYRAKNKDAMNAYNKEWRSNNRERYNANMRAWYAKNKERVQAQRKAKRGQYEIHK